MLRVLFNTFTLLCVVLFLLSAALWARGQFAEDTLRRGGKYSMNAITITRSGVAIFYLSYPDVSQIAYLEPETNGWVWESNGPKSFAPEGYTTFRDHLRIDVLGVHFSGGAWLAASPSVLNYNLVHIPHWLIMLLTIISPVIWWLRRSSMASRRAALGLCVKCGYDLRGTPDSEGTACPECGAARA